MPTKLQVLYVKTVSPAPPQPLVTSREVWLSYRAPHLPEPRVVLRARQRRRWITVLRLFELSNVLFSILLLYCHFDAHAVASSKSVPGCGVRMHPWFATNYSSAVIQINCHRIASSGAELDITQQLEGLERDVLTEIIFNQCPSLEMPAIITEFSRLQVLETFNTSIRTWSLSSGALTHAKQPQLIQVHLVDTNVSSFPEGLIHGELPRGLSLLFYNTNLTELPSEIGHKWGTKACHTFRLSTED